VAEKIIFLYEFSAALIYLAEMSTPENMSIGASWVNLIEPQLQKVLLEEFSEKCIKKSFNIDLNRG